MKVLSDLGVLRLALAVVVLALIGLAPFTGGPARYEGFGFVSRCSPPPSPW